MAHGDRHFAKFVGGGNAHNGEDVVILGYRAKTNEVLVAFLSALSITEAQELRRIAQSDMAQKKDYLMDVVGGSVLGQAHHPSGKDWQTYLIQAASRGGRAVRRVTMKDLQFLDESQKAFFGGYGPSIEPEVDRVRKARARAQESALTGAPLPEPTPDELQRASQSLGYTAQPPAPAAPSEQDTMLKSITESLAMLAQQQAALTQAISGLKSNDEPKKPTRKTTTTTRRRSSSAQKAKSDEAPAKNDPAVVGSDGETEVVESEG